MAMVKLAWRGAHNPGGARALAPLTLVRPLAVLITLLSGIGVVFAVAANAQTLEAEEVTLRSDGTAVVKLLVKLNSGVNEIALPADPIVATLTVTVNGEVVPAIYEGGTLYIIVAEPSDALIEYLVSLDTGDQGVEFTYTPLTGQARLILEPGVVLLGLPANVIDYYEDDNRLVIIFSGESLIRYILAPERPPLEQQQPPPEATTAQPGDAATSPDEGAQQAAETATTIQAGAPEGEACREKQLQ